MTKQFFKDAFGWGSFLWLLGYILGIIFFIFMPSDLVGWAIMPIGIVVTIWVSYKKIKNGTYLYYLKLAIVWTLIAIIYDYIFLVKVFNPADGYYKLDVYCYYGLIFTLPLIVSLQTHGSK